MKDLALMVKKLERKQKDSHQFKNTKLEKGRDRKTGKKGQYQGKYTSGTGGSTREVTQETKAEAGRTESASTAGRWGTSPSTAKSRTAKEPVQDEDDEGHGVGQPWGESNFIELNKYYHSNHLDLEKLDILEGISTDEAEYSEHLEGNPVEEIEVGVKVVDGLKAKSHIWEDFGAGKMVLQVINTGLRLNFTGESTQPI